MISFDSLNPQADTVIAKYPQKRSAVMPLLHLIQERDRHVSKEAIEWVAGKLSLQPINVLEIVTFYPSFKQKSMGKIHLRVCKTLSCMMAGAEETGKAICGRLNCKMGETREDGEVSIEWVECLACCDKAPVVMVNDKLHMGITVDKVDKLIAETKVPVTAKA
jgi:NADH-quinone oxidoreductase subunit E